jgi:hypothetical protein
MEIEQWREQVRQSYRRAGLSEEQIDERLQKKWFEQIEFRQKQRRLGWTEEQIDARIQKLREGQIRWDNLLKTMEWRSAPVNRRKIWPSPKENVRVKLKPCLNCGHQPTFVKEWLTDHPGSFHWANHKLKCSSCKRELSTSHNWRPYIPLKNTLNIRYREYSRLQMISAWNHWNSPRAKTTTCAVKKWRKKTEVALHHVY